MKEYTLDDAQAVANDLSDISLFLNSTSWSRERSITSHYLGASAISNRALAKRIVVYRDAAIAQSTLAERAESPNLKLNPR